eukprot:TRINITY_DN41630_c0_g1_i1.p1 TRINITY_DN41630_c0_g1~~TRINITY_DN41630_c0_g1_i1.p1  ORF type:complete len:332 (+),score=42.01 TRINITY_DN41630_c0_g1_i1:52-996(+)
MVALRRCGRSGRSTIKLHHRTRRSCGILRAASTLCQGAKDWRDPHSISSDLDASTSEAIIHRLESRGRDEIFCSLFDSYFDFVIQNCSKVLEIGAGTGVVCRALAARNFAGYILGADQSPTFVRAAEKFAAAEGLDASRIQFCVADARRLRADLQHHDFDCVIMHTLISHVDDPAAILRQARQVATPGATLIIVDGDYTGLSYHSAALPELSEVVSKSLVRATFASPCVVRDVPRFLQETGWTLKTANGKCVTEMGTEFSYWKSFAEAYMPRVIGSGLVEASLVDRWWQDQLSQARRKAFFATCSYYTLMGAAR